MNKEAIELIEFKKHFCEQMIEVTEDYTAPIYKDMVKENRIYDYILSKLKNDEDNYINENTNLKQALNEIREYIINRKFKDREFPLKDILQIIDKVLGDDEK